MISNSKILITGGYGFIGANVAKLLAKDSLKNQITIFDRNTGKNTSGNDLGLNKYKNVKIIEGSILNLDDFKQVGDDFDYIIHAAGFLGIQKVAENQLLTLDINILGTKNCLEIAKNQTKKPHVLFFSTSEIYGQDSDGHDELSPCLIPSEGKRWSYAASKFAGEYYLKAYIQEYGIKGSIVRPFNVFGPYRYGSNAITSITEKAINNELITISGDGQQIRSWCYIDDFSKGLISILHKCPGNGEAYNIGDNRHVYTMLELANKITDLSESSSEIIVSNNEGEDVKFRLPNIIKAKEKLNYEPESNFDESLLNVIKWAKQANQLT